MRFIIGEVLYEFKIAGSGDFSTTGDNASGEFCVDLKYRKLESRSPAIELRRSLRLPRVGAEASMSALMFDALQEFEVPEDVRENMGTNFKFHLERLARLNSRRNGNIQVTVTLDVRSIPAEKAAEVQRRRHEASRRDTNQARVSPAAPARREAVEALERERMRREEEERDCGICLERLGVGEEVIKMPCFHVYHEKCIVSWLDWNHFCPFCHFKLPC